MAGGKERIRDIDGQARQSAGQAGHQERQDNTGAGDFNAHAGDDENAGPDDLGNANDQEVEAGEALA